MRKFLNVFLNKTSLIWFWFNYYQYNFFCLAAFFTYELTSVRQWFFITTSRKNYKFSFPQVREVVTDNSGLMKLHNTSLTSVVITKFYVVYSTTRALSHNRLVFVSAKILPKLYASLHLVIKTILTSLLFKP